MPTTQSDDAVCRQMLRKGSKSFSAASLLLPRRLRQPVAALYAFCRVADDAIDEGAEPALALRGLEAALDRVYAGVPADDPIERALARVVHEHRIARAVLDALLEGFATDARGDRIADESALLDYAVRVASTVGVAVTLMMGVRDRDVLARASDLGVAMQLTNIARDVGEDAARGRIYLPTAWFHEHRLDRDRWLAAPRFEPAIAMMIERALALAETYYRRAETGIPSLPADCRPAIRAAAWIYADIGRVIRSRGGDAITGRARTSMWRKLVLLMRALRAKEPSWRPLPSEPAVPLARRLIEACVGAEA